MGDVVGVVGDSVGASVGLFVGIVGELVGYGVHSSTRPLALHVPFAHAWHASTLPVTLFHVPASHSTGAVDPGGNGQ